jgi:hypothetical protein
MPKLAPKDVRCFSVSTRRNSIDFLYHFFLNGPQRPVPSHSTCYRSCRSDPTSMPISTNSLDQIISSQESITRASLTQPLQSGPSSLIATTFISQMWSLTTHNRQFDLQQMTDKSRLCEHIAVWFHCNASALTQSLSPLRTPEPRYLRYVWYWCIYWVADQAILYQSWWPIQAKIELWALVKVVIGHWPSHKLFKATA